MSQNNDNSSASNRNQSSPNVKPALPDLPQPTDPLRLSPQIQRKGSPLESPQNPSISNVGSSDLDPFARPSPSGGMFVNPREHPLFAERDQRNSFDAFGPKFDPLSGAKLPSSHPSGARFDAYSPFKDQRFGPDPFNPGKGFKPPSVPGEPDFDEFIPKKGNFDNYFS